MEALYAFLVNNFDCQLKHFDKTKGSSLKTFVLFEKRVGIRKKERTER